MNTKPFAMPEISEIKKILSQDILETIRSLLQDPETPAEVVSGLLESIKENPKFFLNLLN